MFAKMDKRIPKNENDVRSAAADRAKKLDRRTKVCRNLFGPCAASSGVTPWDEVFAEQKRIDFSHKWGWNVETDMSEPDSPWQWERVDDKDVPEALQRLGGCRVRRHSEASVGSGEDACHSRSNSFSTPAAESDQNNPAKMDLSDNRNSDLVLSSRTLITDYLKSQAKRSRTAKDSRALSSRPSDAVGH